MKLSFRAIRRGIAIVPTEDGKGRELLPTAAGCGCSLLAAATTPNEPARNDKALSPDTARCGSEVGSAKRAAAACSRRQQFAPFLIRLVRYQIGDQNAEIQSLDRTRTWRDRVCLQ